MFDDIRVSDETLSVFPTSVPCFNTKPVSPLDSLHSVSVEGLQVLTAFGAIQTAIALTLGTRRHIILFKDLAELTS